MSEDLKPAGDPISGPSHRSPTSNQLAAHAHSALAYVDQNSDSSLQIEPSLAVLPQSIQPVLPAKGVPQHLDATTSTSNSAVPASVGSTADINAELAISGAIDDSPRTKRINRACDPCSKRKVKVSQVHLLALAVVVLSHMSILG
jgi:hypothetical protein